MKVEIFMALSTTSSISFFLKYDEIVNDIGVNGKTQRKLSSMSYLRFMQGSLILLTGV